MARFRTKTREIEATQWFPGVLHPGLLENALTGEKYVLTLANGNAERSYLTDGYWIVPGRSLGVYDLYAPDVFEKNYEPV